MRRVYERLSTLFEFLIPLFFAIPTLSRVCPLPAVDIETYPWECSSNLRDEPGDETGWHSVATIGQLQGSRLPAPHSDGLITPSKATISALHKWKMSSHLVRLQL
jgi:hypothetical protein